MSDIAIESAHGPLDSFLLSNLGFKGFAPTNALGIVFLCEFMRVYTPAVFQGLSFVLSLLPIPRFWGEEYEIEGATASERGDPVIVPEKYSTFHDDRKAKKGGDNDVYMLRTHGFDKYRHVSKAFMKRNNLIRSGALIPTAVKSASSKGKKGKGKRKKKPRPEE